MQFVPLIPYRIQDYHPVAVLIRAVVDKRRIFFSPPIQWETCPAGKSQERQKGQCVLGKRTSLLIPLPNVVDALKQAVVAMIQHKAKGGGRKGLDLGWHRPKDEQASPASLFFHRRHQPQAHKDVHKDCPRRACMTIRRGQTGNGRRPRRPAAPPALHGARVLEPGGLLC